MSLRATWFRDRLRKKSKRGFQGFPVATVAYYGPNNARASKVAVSIILSEGAEPVLLERWYSEEADARADPSINETVLHFLQQHGAKSVVMADRIIGCQATSATDPLTTSRTDPRFVDRSVVDVG